MTALPAALTVVDGASLLARAAAPDMMEGMAWVEAVLASTRDGEPTVYRVTHAPGARSRWHRHPHGQILLVLAGVCLVQRRGEPLRRARAGDAVWIPPDAVHWHGAAEEGPMIYASVQGVRDARAATWEPRGSVEVGEGAPE